MRHAAKTPVMRDGKAGRRMGMDDLAVEAHVKLCSDEGHEVHLLATPEDLEDLAVGHALCEGWWTGLGPVPTAKASQVDSGHRVDLTGGPWSAPGEPRTILPSCGGCGLELDPPTPGTRVRHGEGCTSDELRAHLAHLRNLQPLYLQTGGTHAAALVLEGELLVREDIGRHSAVDKAIGAWLRSVESNDIHAMLISGRCGWDVMAKIVRSGVRQLAAVGAVSAQAAALARHAGVRVMGFASGDDPQFIGPWN